MAKVNIDLEKLICSYREELERINHTFHVKAIDKALDDQGIEYKDGSLHYIGEEIKHKYKVGDYIVYKESKIYNIVKIDERGYYVNIEDVPNGILDFKEEVFMRKWTILDAEPGEVIVDKDGNLGLFEVAGNYSWHSHCYCSVTSNIIYEHGTHPDIKSHPATQEQKKYFFSKMKEADYKFDDATQTLEKIDASVFDLPTVERDDLPIISEKPATIKFEEEPKKKVKLADLDDMEELRTTIKESIRRQKYIDQFERTNEATEAQQVIGSGEKMSNIDAMVEEYKKKTFETFDKASSYYLTAVYRQGLEDMWKHLKGE